MKEFIDKLIERLEEKAFIDYDEYYTDGGECLISISDVKEIVNELAEEYNKKQEHEILLNGCDDDTIFTMEMTNNEYEFLKRVAELANKTSTYSCMPRLFVDYTEGE